MNAVNTAAHQNDLLQVGHLDREEDDAEQDETNHEHARDGRLWREVTVPAPNMRTRYTSPQTIARRGVRGYD